MIGSCTEAKRVGSRSRYQLYYVTGHRCDASARLPPKMKKVVERKEELQRSATARSITRARTRETRFADQIGEDGGETRKKKNKGRSGGRKRKKIETTRRRGHDVVEKKETSERASERKRSFVSVKRQETTVLRPRYTSNMAAEGRIGGGQPRCRRRRDARASLTSTQTQRSSLLSAPTALLRLKRSPPTLRYSSLQSLLAPSPFISCYISCCSSPSLFPFSISSSPFPFPELSRLRRLSLCLSSFSRFVISLRLSFFSQRISSVDNPLHYHPRDIRDTVHAQRTHTCLVAPAVEPCKS